MMGVGERASERAAECANESEIAGGGGTERDFKPARTRNCRFIGVKIGFRVQTYNFGTETQNTETA